VAAIRAHELALCEQLRAKLGENPAVTFVGHADNARRVGTLSFRCEGLPSEDVAGILDTSFEIAVRAGNHCAPYVHKAVGSYDDGLVRVSPGPFNTEADVDRLAAAITEIVGGS
jgi:selenocysteine lyase/cysteine desulfurase